MDKTKTHYCKAPRFSIVNSMVGLSRGFGLQGCNCNQSKNYAQDLETKSVADIISLQIILSKIRLYLPSTLYTSYTSSLAKSSCAVRNSLVLRICFSSLSASHLAWR